MISSRQSETCVSSLIGSESSNDMQPVAPAPASAAKRSLAPSRPIAIVIAPFFTMTPLSAAVARRVEPPLGAEAEEVLDLVRGEREHVVLGIERPEAVVPRRDQVDEPELRSRVVSPPGQRQ